MTAVLITYDLVSPGQKYAALTEKIKDYGTWAHIGGSTWIVAGYGLSPEGVRDDLRTVLDDNDTMLTIDVTGARNSGWLTQPIWDWMRSNVGA